jgi:tetratricopeptide (TPR) repeat protein
MAFVYSSLNNYDKAIEYADLVLFQNKNDSLAKEIKATCLLNKAESSFQSENYKEFIFYLEKSFELVSGEASIYVHYASVFFELKYYENALHYAQKTLESDPENQLANDIRSESFKCLKFDWNYFLIHC